MRYFTTNRRVAITKIFDSVKVNEDLSKFSNTLENGWLVTKYDEREICRTEVSKIYYNFDFTSFSKSILSEVLNYFTPERYSLRIISGVQELRLIGDELYIDNERYEKMISILNSTDKSRALSMSVGLIKVNKGQRPQSYTILTSFSNKHYKSSLPDKIKSFSDNLINFNINIDFHIKTIEDLKNKNVKIVDFAKSILYKDGKYLKSVELKLRALGKSLVYNYGIKNYNTLTNLTGDKLDKISESENIEINAKMLHNAYVELFKDSDTSIISRESRRIIEALDSI